MDLTLDKIYEAMKLVENIGATKLLEIFENIYLCKSKQVRFPISKKKRICKKWTKNLKNWISYPDPNYYRFGNQVFCHPATANILRRELGKAEKKNNYE